MVNTNPVYYPFSVVPSVSNTNVYPYDIVINTVYPGLIFDSAEAGGTYAVIREVNGCLWFAVNADFDETTLQWTQEDPTNPNTPAYAMEICANGTWNWYSGLPTLIPGTPVVWRQVVLIDANGSIISTPQTVTASGDPSQQVNVTWNLGGAAQAVARQVDVTDTSSSATSLLDNLEVNGVPKWSVDKNGVLTVGMVPASSVINLFVNPTFTGTSTFTGPVVMNSTLDVFGAMTAHSSLTADTTFFVVGNSNLNGGVDVFGGETIHSGGINVTGGTTTDTLHVPGVAVFNSTVENGSGGPVIPISSPDNSISVVTSGNGYQIEVPTHGLGTSVVSYTENITGPTPSAVLSIPGTGTQQWAVSMTAVVTMTAPLAAGTLMVSGSGGGASWAASTNDSSNSNQIVIPILLGGNSFGGNVITANFISSGGTIDHADVNLTAIRFI